MDPVPRDGIVDHFVEQFLGWRIVLKHLKLPPQWNSAEGEKCFSIWAVSNVALVSIPESVHKDAHAVDERAINVE